MWKKAAALALILVFALGITAQATAPLRIPTKNVTISFQGTTAICRATLQTDVATDKVSVTMKLWHNGRVIETWTQRGTYAIRMKETVSVVKGQSYKLTMDSTINGVRQSTKTATGTCP